MSQYPYGGYPQYPPQPPQPPQHPYAYQQPYNPYATPAYPPPPHPTPVEGQYAAASQSSFDYNANRIPGLGIFGAPQGSPTYPPQNHGSWNAGLPMMGVSPAAPSPIPAQGTAYHYPPPQAQSSYAAPAAPHASPQHASPPVHENAQARDDSAEEGELSEGELEDIYEPRPPGGVAANAPQPKIPTAPAAMLRKAGSSGSQSVVDAQDTPLYEDSGENEGQAIPKDSSDSDAAGRERSGSYSPHLSPREIQRDSSASGASGHDSNTAAVPKASLASQNPPTGQIAPGSTPGQSAKSKSSATFRSLTEAKKEAQKAILRLLPHGVKYQTYIDEGFDENTVRTLFTELNLAPAANSPSQPQPEKDQPKKEAGSAAAGGAETPAKKGEERKDRIARLLAAKAAKTSPTENAKPAEAPPTPAATAAPAAASTGAPPKTRAEKELLLQRKMEALMKSREARAHISPPATAQAPKEQGPAERSATTPQTDHRPPPIGQATAAQVATPERQSSLPVQTTIESSTPLPSSIPGLVVPSDQQAVQQTNQRKRPVAADFVDYPASNGSFKRPFGQARKESTLVIDISDGSDDEDVEMEMDSPVDGNAGKAQQAPLSRRGPSIRDYPPLSGGHPPRQFSSPVHPPRTPPTTAGLRQQESVLDRKMREIAEMKRRIAEREEAKKKGKQDSASPQTPSAGDSTPTEAKDGERTGSVPRQLPSTAEGEISGSLSPHLISEAHSAQPPKQAELSAPNRRPRRTRSMRVSSMERFADIEEKRRLLEARKAEIAKMEAELAQEEAEKARLEAEEQAHGDDDSDSAPEPEFSSPESRSEAGDAESSSRDQSAAENSSQEQTAHEVTTDSSNEVLQQPSAREAEEDSARSEPASEAMEIEQPSHDDTAEAQPGLANGTIGASIETHDEPGVHHQSTETRLDSTVKTDLASDRPEVEDASGVAMPEDVAMDEPTPEREVSAEAATPGKPDAPVPGGSTEQVPLDPSSPIAPERGAGAEPTAEPADLRGGSETAAAAATLPTQISSVDVPTDEAAFEDHAETAEAAREDVEQGALGAKRQSSSFTPYDSPLRHFHAYRFHPRYNQTVPGGLKSLTYSNRIDAKKEYQHFQNMAAPDDQILLELGRSDDYTGEQKTRFVAGLRELLTTFRAQKIKDFPTIARGIIEFRRRFLGDPTKVLHLEGTSV